MSNLCLACELACDVKSKCINCDSCKRYIHSQCTGLTSAELKCFDLKAKRKLKYFCDDCEKGLQVLPEVLSKLTKLTAEVTLLKNFIGKVESEGGKKDFTS